MGKASHFDNNAWETHEIFESQITVCARVLLHEFHDTRHKITTTQAMLNTWVLPHEFDDMRHKILNRLNLI